MDTYGIINLTELDRMIEEWEKKYIEAGLRDDEKSKSEMDLWFNKIYSLQLIKELCLKLPSAAEVFFANEVECDHYDDHEWKYKSFKLYMDDYITQFIKSDKP